MPFAYACAHEGSLGSELKSFTCDFSLEILGKSRRQWWSLRKGLCEGMIAAFCGSFGWKSLWAGDIVDKSLSVLRNGQSPGVGRPESKSKVQVHLLSCAMLRPFKAFAHSPFNTLGKWVCWFFDSVQPFRFYSVTSEAWRTENPCSLSSCQKHRKPLSSLFGSKWSWLPCVSFALGAMGLVSAEIRAILTYP